jgi:archaellum biogenesis ATPase FlaH
VVADFLFSPPEWVPSRVWRVQGSYWHFASSQKQMEDLLQRLRLEEKGFVVVDILSIDVLRNRDAVLTAALEGRQLMKTPILV